MIDTFNKALDRYLGDVPAGTFQTSIEDYVLGEQQHRSHVPTGAWPRGLNADQAAAYVGLKRTKFLDEVKAGIWPAPLKFFGKRTVWDRHLLDRALDNLAASNGMCERKERRRLGERSWL